MMKSYAQNFEDVLLWRALREVPHGFYVDLGAQHPVLDSVSCWFYQQGWRGVHVEPVPFYAELLRQHRPDEDVIESVISDEAGDHVIYVFPDTGLSTMSIQIAETHKAQLKREWEERVVSSITLADLFAANGNREVHWLKVDVEGHERAALSSWGNNAVRPWIVLVEATFPNSQIETHDEWETLLTSRGYRFVYADGLNRYYLHERHEDLRDRFRYPPNYFDQFSLGEHWATYELRNDNRQALQEAEDKRRWAEEERAQALAGSDERDANLSASITGHVNEKLTELETRVTHGHEALEARLSGCQNDMRAEFSQLLAQGGQLKALVEGIQADVVSCDKVLRRTEETWRSAWSQMDLDRRFLFGQIGELATDLKCLEQSLRITQSSRWQALRTLLKPRKAGLLAGTEKHSKPPLLGQIEIPDNPHAQPARGPDSLSKHTDIRVQTLGELFSLPPAEFIRVSYRILLDRDADQGGLSHYLSRMGLGDSRDTIHRSILNSKEYRKRAACADLLELDDEAFIEAAYRRLLGRAADEGGRAHYLAQLRIGKARAGVLKSLARSTEARAVSQPSVRLRQEIEKSTRRRWPGLSSNRSAKRLLQLDFRLSTAIDRLEGEVQRQLGDLRASMGQRSHHPSSEPVNDVALRLARPRWVPRDFRMRARSPVGASEDRAELTHADYRDLAERMRRGAGFGQFRNSREGQQFNDYFEGDYEPEDHGGDMVRWVREEATIYLRATGSRLNIEAAGFFEDRSVLIFLDSVVVGKLDFTKERSVEGLSVTDWVGEDVVIRLKCSGFFNPAAAGVSSDTRDLGLLIRAIYFD
ncbi:FkbM family methyltransferase [Sphingobium sp. B1D7B]|uniref:FkbM family methyltransferase n=1 Tax=unclassified Sphingobium TaxID=2611147 RepID=UPI002225458C|nr:MULTISPECIES: FkbM family methyltransferase [unclassified Sphingobium]MCW2391905.1 FkbM family methyltransferase [Sphingobium sp. B11D3A]MCW2403661.1 FkbM family methyltransferase [Sphingobium sp. B1D7B]